MLLIKSSIIFLESLEGVKTKHTVHCVIIVKHNQLKNKFKSLQGFENILNFIRILQFTTSTGKTVK